MLFAAATCLGPQGVSTTHEPFGWVGQMSLAMTPTLGARLGPLVFSAGVLGASMVAAVISSLALAWGVGELCGVRRSLEAEPRRLPWFYWAYVAVIIAAVAVVLLAPDLLWVNVVAQTSNIVLLPLILPCLIFLASNCLPVGVRLQGGYLWLTVGVSVLTCGCGAVGAVQGLLRQG